MFMTANLTGHTWRSPAKCSVAARYTAACTHHMGEHCRKERATLHRANRVTGGPHAPLPQLSPPGGCVTPLTVVCT
ncbi:hypothetical protein GCM10008937_34250 [Deinococcus depolymerans]|uniref:Uncharacterized protein n=1 Tax=Deinococcus depolymerans TaxID=392408 RepID=A0ABP3MNR1_9DEIO